MPDAGHDFSQCVTPEFPSRPESHEVILSKQGFEKPLPQALLGLWVGLEPQGK